MRYFIEFAYNGKNYCGWQAQPHSPSVQETLNRALSLLLKTEIDVVGAGRTDTGVHARQMFAHFDHESIIEPDHMVKRLNAFLPKDIVVYCFIPLHDDAHARFDATARTYEYHIHTFKDAFDHEASWYNFHPIDIEKMNIAARELFNYTDFKCFSKAHTDVKTYNCDVREAYWTQEGTKLIFTVTADRFLRNMVRAIVGTLVNVGLGKITIDEFKAIIESRDRSRAGFSVPAHGLYLTKVIYPYI